MSLRYGEHSATFTSSKVFEEHLQPFPRELSTERWENMKVRNSSNLSALLQKAGVCWGLCVTPEGADSDSCRYLLSGCSLDFNSQRIIKYLALELECCPSAEPPGSELSSKMHASVLVSGCAVRGEKEREDYAEGSMQ